jgi:crossover junction endodeoxyribonuclease RuvC
MPPVVGAPITAYIERVHAMPKQGVSSVFTFGMGFGSILSTLQLLPASIRFVTPNVWKKAAGLGRDKGESLDRARLMFPTVRLDRKKDHGQAEALLIAHYGLSQQRAVAT